MVRLNKNHIKGLVKKILKEVMINELDLGDFKVIKILGFCKLNGGYKVAIAESRGIKYLIVTNSENEVSAMGPRVDFLVGKSKEVICNIAQQLMDELIVESDRPLKKSCWKGYETIGIKTKNGKKVPNCVPIKENEKHSNNYMFWQNLETIKQAVNGIMEMDRDEVDELISDGHGWVLDHIATSADDIDEVYHFLYANNKKVEENYKYDYEMFGTKLIEEDEFGSVELITEGEGKGPCANRALNKPWLTPSGPKKRSVCVKNAEGNVVKVNFGDPNMKIKKSNPERRKSFRARHRCENPGPKWKARYWSCKAW